MQAQWLTRLRHSVIVGFVFCVLTSCGDSDEGLAPVEPAPPSSLTDLFGQVLLDSGGDTVLTETISNTSLVAIYFEGYWCSSCAAFTPQLISTYDELQLEGESFEVVLVSFDVNRQELIAHMIDRDMPWLAVPPDGGMVGALAQRYGVQFIPTLVIVDSDARTVTLGGRDDVVVKGASAFDDWLAASGGS